MCAIPGVLLVSPTAAQHGHDDGSGHSWPADLSIVEVRGIVVVNGVAPDQSYFIDEDGDHAGDYRLMLGPRWYESAFGASWPAEGDTIMVAGSLVDNLSSPAVLMVFSIDGQTWRMAVEYGMHGWNGGAFWIETGDTLTTSGTVLVDTTYFYHQYFLDEDADGSPEFRLGLGPHWYEPEGLRRPVNGQAVAVRGILHSGDGIDMLSVYELDDQTWRSFGDTAPWAGDWMARDHADSLFTFCANDSIHWLGFPSGHMDGHHMGMSWPDSSFAQFWRIHPDSLPGPGDASHLMGFYVDMHDPFGMSMMDGQFGGHGGMMQFSREFTMRLHYRDEDLMLHNVTEGDLAVSSWDAGTQQWITVTTATIEPQTNAITFRGSSLSNYYSVSVLGTATATEDRKEVPSDFMLFQNYPNPFNPATTIRFSVPAAQHVRLVVYDLAGRKVLTLLDGFRSAGPQDIVLDARALPSGTYIYRLEGADGVEVRKLTLLR